MRVWIAICILAGVMAVLLAGCGGGSNSGSSARVRLLLGDAPIVLADGTAIDAVNVPVQSIQLLGATDDETTAITLYQSDGNPAPLDLLGLANLSLTQLKESPIANSLGTVSIPAGHYTQMRLILGSGATVMRNGEPVDLKVPSGMQTGLKVAVNLDLGTGTVQDLLLDFNLTKLDYQPNSARFILPPNALRLVKLTQTATLTGTVTVTTPEGGLTDDVVVKLTVCDAAGNPVLVNGVTDATIDTVVNIPAGETSATYAMNGIPAGLDSYLLQPTVMYGEQTPVQAPVAISLTGGQTTVQDIAITGLE